MPGKPTTPKEQARQIRHISVITVFLIMLCLVIFFIIVSFYGGGLLKDSEVPLSPMFWFIVVITLVLNTLVYRLTESKIKKMDKNRTLFQKLVLYYVEYSQQLALPGFCALLGLVYFLLSADEKILIIIAILLGIIIYQRPSLEKLSRVLDLTEEEIKEIL